MLARRVRREREDCEVDYEVPGSWPGPNHQHQSHCLEHSEMMTAVILTNKRKLL